MKFETQIIENVKYPKYKKIRGVLFLLLVVVGVPAYFMGNSSSNRRNLSEDLREFTGLQYYYLVLIIIGICYGLVHYFTWKIKETGRLSVSEDGIIVENSGQEVRLTFSEIQRLSFSRGSTYHKGDEDFQKPYRGDNFMEIRGKDGSVWKYEFAINSFEHNRDFELLMKSLRGVLGARFRFVSV